MSVAKHTPSPWFVPVKSDYEVRAHTASGINVRVVLCRNDEGAEEEGSANARLIAAAPELLAACEDMDAWFSALLPLLGQLPDKGEAVRESFHRNRAAIFKARGES